MGTLVGQKRTGSARIRSSNGIPLVDESYEYTVQGAAGEGRISILENTPGLPRVGLSITAEGGAVCKTADAQRREGNALIWDVTAEFSSEVDESQQNPDPSTNPEAWIPVRETKSERIQEVVTTDQSGDAIANSAGQSFANGLTITRLIPVWEFFQIESAGITDETILGRSEVVNESTYKGKAAKTWLLTVLSSVVGYYYGQPRRLTRYSIKYNHKTWQHKRLDVGTVWKDGSNLEPYEDNKGNIINGPLNGTGGKQAAGTAPAILTFDQFAVSDFAFLRI